MNAKQDNSHDDRSSSTRYSDEFDSDDGKRTQTPKRPSSPKKNSHHHYYQDKFRGRGKGPGSMRGRNPGRGGKRGRGNSRTSEPPDVRKGQDSVATRVLSASRHRINELRNKVEELNIHVRNLHQENKLYKKMQFRQEKVIRVYEDKENDLPSILDRHNNEIRSLREQNKRLKEKYEKADRYLRDAEDELERVKKKMNKYKEICDQQELQERDELSRKLGQAQVDLEEKETKLKELKRYVEMLKKNHRHELGIEVARQREMKKQVDDLLEKNSQLENQLKEKEKALEYLNIYSNPQHGRPSRDNSPDGSPASKLKKKTSSISELTPRDKAKFYAEKQRAELLKQRDLKEEKERKKKKQWEKEEREKEQNTAPKSSSEFVFGSRNKEKEERDRLEEEKRQEREVENKEKQEEELQKRQRELEKRKEQDKLDRMNKENRERKEREESEKREKDEWERRERKKHEEKERREQDEKRERAERERKEHERKERERMEEEEKEKAEHERKLQLEKEKLDNDPHLQAERKKKDELLKKVRALDEMGSADSDPFSPSSPLRKNKEQPHTSGIKDMFESPTRRNELKEYSFTKPVNNLHQGKPSHEDVTVPYLDRQRNKRQTSNDPGGYQPSFGPTRGEAIKTSTTKPPSIFDDDEPIFKISNTSSDLAMKQSKKSTNLLENLFPGQAITSKNIPPKSRKENDTLIPQNTSPFSNNQTKTLTTLPWDKPLGATPSYKTRLDSGNKSTILDETLIGDDLPEGTNKVLPRRHRTQNLNTFSAKPSVTAIDNFDDEIEELVLS